MSVAVRCECTARFEVADELAGGMTNCPRCGRATAVPGLRDPFWRVLQVGAVVGAAAASVAVGSVAGHLAAALTLIGALTLLWLLSRAL